jgi:hypothetical protein
MAIWALLGINLRSNSGVLRSNSLLRRAASFCGQRIHPLEQGIHLIGSARRLRSFNVQSATRHVNQLAGDVRGPPWTRIGTVWAQPSIFDMLGRTALHCTYLAAATNSMSARHYDVMENPTTIRSALATMDTLFIIGLFLQASRKFRPFLLLLLTRSGSRAAKFAVIHNTPPV